MTRTHILNFLVNSKGYKSYLEVGVQNVRNNFNRINCINKLGVDPAVDDINVIPMTSDQFFDCNQRTFDLIFIDGLHEYDQVKKDLDNSLKILNDGGIIMLHDTLPEEEITTMVPRQTQQWHGDVYKLVLDLNSYENVNFYTIDSDCGCTIVWKSVNKAKKYPLTWESYLKNKKAMNIIGPHDFLKHI